MLSRSPEIEGADGDLDALIRKAQVIHIFNIKQKKLLGCVMFVIINRLTETKDNHILF